MQRLYYLALVSMIAATFSLGCNSATKDEAKNTEKDKQEKKQEDKEEAHAHSDADALNWPKENIEHEGFVISLGHHGGHFHGGDHLEPAVAVSKDGNDVGDATMSCELMSADGKSLVVGPKKMIFEPKTEAEPAHYAQGELELPKKDASYQVKFVITLPGVDKVYEDTIDLKVGH